VFIGIHDIFFELFESYWNDWKELDTIHLLINHRDYMDPNYSTIKEFDEINILNYNFTFGFMCREVMTRIKKFIT
jgi:hypothetical protein